MNISAILTEQRNALTGFFRSRGFSTEDAEDLVQETLYKVLNHQENGDSIENVEGWLFTIARNVAIDHARKSTHRTTEPLDDHEPGIAPEPIDSTCRCMYGVIDRLPENRAEAIRLVDLGGTPQTVAAAQLGISRAALKVRLHHARKQLRKMLEDTCGSCASGSHCLDCSCGG